MVIAFLAACEAPPASEPAASDTAETPAAEGSLPEVPDAEDLDPAEGAVRVRLAAGVLDAGYAYNGVSPGPTIRARVGDTVTVELENTLGDSTTVHWHGLRVPNAMDGVSWVADPVPAGGAFTYTFTVPDAGTFWYHPHVDVSRQVDLGLYGAFVVEDPTEPAAERDLVLVFDALAEFAEDEADHHHLPPDPNRITWTVNGAVLPNLALAVGERARVRIVNAANTSYLALDWPGATVLAGQQGLGAAPDTVVPPGGRIELEVRQGDVEVRALPWSAAGGAAWGEPRAILTTTAEGEPADPLPYAIPDDAPSADPGTTDVRLVFQGGGEGGDWLINAEAWPEVTPSIVPLGIAAVIEVRNLSATSHPFHLHGHRFEVLSVDGVVPAVRTVADTLDVGIRSTARLLFVADNPGEWAAHCHLLSHEGDGMMTTVRVE